MSFTLPLSERVSWDFGSSAFAASTLAPAAAALVILVVSAVPFLVLSNPCLPKDGISVLVVGVSPVVPCAIVSRAPAGSA